MIWNLITSSYGFMDRLSKQWWLYLVFTIIVFTPPLTSTGFASITEIEPLAMYVSEILIHNREILTPYMPIFHIGVIIFLSLLVILGNRFGRVFSVIVGIQILFLMFLQASAVTPKFGWVIYTNGFILISLMAFIWFWEGIIRKTDFTFRKLTLKDSWIVLFALFAFWNPGELGNYSLELFLISTSPIALCMMMTIYLSLLCILYPRINIPMFRITSFIVILMSLVAISLGFFFEIKSEGIYWIFLHLPLLIISVYGFQLGIRHRNLFV